MMSSGGPIRQRPIASICCSPPERVPASCRRRSAQAREQREHLVERLRRAGARARQHRAHLQVLGTVRHGKTWRPSATWPMPRLQTRCDSAAGDVAGPRTRSSRARRARCRRWCGSARTCRRRWRRRSRRSRLRALRARRRRAPARRRRRDQIAHLEHRPRVVPMSGQRPRRGSTRAPRGSRTTSRACRAR